MRTRLALLLLALLAPLAAGGTETEPDLSDPRGDAPAESLDILAVWFEDAPAGVHFTVKVASLPQRSTSRLYEIGFRSGVLTESVAVGFDGQGALRSSVDTEGAWGGGPGSSASTDDALLDESVQRGAPGYLRATIPPARFEWRDGTAVRFTAARSTYWDEDKPGGNKWQIGADEVDGSATFTLGGEDPLLPIVVPRWVIPTIVVACTMFGAAGGFAALRWRRARVPTPPPSPSSPAPGPSPPYRMRKDPK